MAPLLLAASQTPTNLPSRRASPTPLILMDLSRVFGPLSLPSELSSVRENIIWRLHLSSCRSYLRWHSFRCSHFPLGNLPRHYRGVDFPGIADQLPLRRAVWIQPPKSSCFGGFRHRPGQPHHLQSPPHLSGIVFFQLPSLPTIGEGYGTTSSTIGARMRKYSESVGRSYVASSVAR